MASDNSPTDYKARFLELRETLVRALGSQTIDLVLERALVEIEPGFPSLSRIRGDDGRLSLEALDQELASESTEDGRAAISALYGSMLVILARMLGQEVALRLARSMDAKRVIGGNLIGE